MLCDSLYIFAEDNLYKNLNFFRRPLGGLKAECMVDLLDAVSNAATKTDINMKLKAEQRML